MTLAEKSPPAIVQLVELGDPRRDLPPCASCHRAVAEISKRVAGGERNTSAQQLKLYASGERRNDVYGRMRMIASRLTEGEMKGLAGYYRAGFK